MNIFKKKNLLAVGFIGLMLVILVMAGCSGTSTPTTSKAPVTTSPAQTTTSPPQTPKITTPVVTTTPVSTYSGDLNISAAASLKDALNAVNDLYIQINPKVKIVANFAGSGTLQTQIEQGAPVDVFISAAAKQMDNLQKEQLLIDYTRHDLLNNKIVLIVPADSTLGLTSFTDLTSAKVKQVAIGDPKSVPAGTYALQAFDELGITAQVQPKEVLGSDVRQVLTYVETGNVDAGIVYSTDALTSSKVKVVASAPADINAKVVYPVAVIKAGSHVTVGYDYVQFLFTDKVKAIFEQYGFTMVGK